MSEIYLDIKQWGDNLGIRLPTAVVRAARLRTGQRVQVSVAARLIVIRPVDESVLTLEQRLAQYDPKRHGGEAMADAPVGAEA